MADVSEFNAATGEVTERDFTPEEAAQRASDALAVTEAQAVADAEQADRETQRAALLARLGITADEAALLIT
ncbi:MAG TPA: hypothetical protein DDY88_08665 [Actinobacteria bacterium]|nr:hypothetical protein [Actinomycetota bacterium]